MNCKVCNARRGIRLDPATGMYLCGFCRTDEAERRTPSYKVSIGTFRRLLSAKARAHVGSLYDRYRRSRVSNPNVFLLEVGV